MHRRERGDRDRDEEADEDEQDVEHRLVPIDQIFRRFVADQMGERPGDQPVLVAREQVAAYRP